MAFLAPAGCIQGAATDCSEMVEQSDLLAADFILSEHLSGLFDERYARSTLVMTEIVQSRKCGDLVTFTRRPLIGVTGPDLVATVDIKTRTVVQFEFDDD
jgi:hypothetical protein